MRPEERKKYREMGGRLAVLIRNRAARSTSTTALQAVVADLVGNQTELLLPLKDLVGRPAFQRLIPKAGSGRGSTERLALLQELERTFAPAITLAVEELLGGFLDLPIGHSIAGRQAETPSAGTSRRSEPAATPFEDAESAAARAFASVPPIQYSSKDSTRNRREPMWAAGWIVAAAASSALILGIVLVMRTPVVCAALGLCESQENAGTQKRLAKAKRAAEELEGSTDIDSYRDAARLLNQVLLTIRSDQLSSDQKVEVERLELMYQRAKVGLKEEQGAEKLLDQASLAIKNAQGLTGDEQKQEIEKALDALNAIPGRSFAAQKASKLKEELLALVPNERPDTGETPKGSATPRQQQIARPTPRTLQGESAKQVTGGWRKPPLWELGPSPPRTPNSTGDLRDQPLF